MADNINLARNEEKRYIIATFALVPRQRVSPGGIQGNMGVANDRGCPCPLLRHGEGELPMPSTPSSPRQLGPSSPGQSASLPMAARAELACGSAALAMAARTELARALDSG